MEMQKVKLFIRVCMVYADYGYLTGLKPEELICLYEECLAMACFLHDNITERIIYYRLGDAYGDIHQLPKAIECYKKCLDIAMKAGSRKEVMVLLYERLGTAYESSAKCHEAIKYHEKSLSIATEIGYRQGEGKAWEGLGNAYRSLCKYHEAIKYHKNSLSIATEIGDRQGEGKSYCNLGNVYLSLGKYHEAIKYHEKHLSIATEVRDRKEEGSAYGNLGVVYRLFGKYHEAIKYHETHLSIAKEIGDRQGEGGAYANLGFDYLSLGKYHEAIKYNEKCLGIVTKLGDKQGEISVYGNLGNAYQSLGKYHEAIEYHKRSLSVATEIGHRQGEGNADGNLGIAYSSLGKYHEAIEYQEKYLTVAKEIGDRQAEGNAYGNLGSVYTSLGKYHEAIKYYKKCLEIATEIGDRRGEGRACGNLGNAYDSLGEYHEAIEYHFKCLDIATEIGDRQGEGSAYGSIGNVYTFLGEYDDAIKYHEKELGIATETGDREAEGNAHGRLGNAYQLLGKYHEAIKYYEKNLSIATEIGDRQGEGAAHHNIGVCYEYDDTDDDHLEKSKEHLSKSIECYELLFDDLKEKDQLKISIFDTFIKSYKILSELCLKTEQTEEALLVSEHGRARALGDLLSLKYNVNKEPASKSAPLTLTDVNDVIMPTSCVLFYDVPFSKKKPFQIWILAERKPLWYVASEIPTSTEDKDVKEKEFITNFVKKSYDSMQVREGMVCEDRTLGVLDDEKQDFDKAPAVPESTQIVERETTKGNVEDEKVSAQARCIEDHDDDDADDKALESLFAALVAPVQDQLIQEEIVIIPDGPLFMVPFAALQDPKTGKFLSEMKRIRLSPSLTTLKLLQESPDDHHYKSGALIVGNPEIGKVQFGGESFCSLPGAEQEAKEIAKLLEVEPLIGRQATKEAVLQRLRVGVSVIHFAAHGSENGQILLAPSTSSATNSIPDEEDCILTMQDAQESGLRAQLVVLSCCHSGRGEIKAEGVVGMARAFLAAGARAVVASLWAIDDDATKEFMLKFYSHLKKGESASKSLQQAMKDMRETECYKEPKYWAAFFLIGDDVTIKTRH